MLIKNFYKCMDGNNGWMGNKYFFSGSMGKSTTPIQTLSITFGFVVQCSVVLVSLRKCGTPGI